MKTNILFFITICFFCNCKAQKTCTVFSEEFYQFSIASGMINKSNSNITGDYSSLFRITELLNNDSTFSHKYGIYKFESYTEDSKTSIVFKKKDIFELYDMSNHSFFMSRLLDFLNDSLWSLSSDKKLSYIQKVIKIYENNSESGMNLIIEENHNQFKFFIDSKIYKK